MRPDDPSPSQVDRVVSTETNPRAAGLLVLAYLRKDKTFAELAAGLGSARRLPGYACTKQWSCSRARAPELRKAVRDAVKAG